MGCLPTLITDRLVLTPLQLEDSPIIQELFPCWEVVRYLDRRVPWPYPEDRRWSMSEISLCLPWQQVVKGTG